MSRLRAVAVPQHCRCVPDAGRRTTGTRQSRATTAWEWGQDNTKTGKNVARPSKVKASLSRDVTRQVSGWPVAVPASGH